MMVGLLIPQLKLLIEAIKKLNGEIWHYYRKQSDTLFLTVYRVPDPKWDPSNGRHED
jgi:hypothetical protein